MFGVGGQYSKYSGFVHSSFNTAAASDAFSSFTLYFEDNLFISILVLTLPQIAI